MVKPPIVKGAIYHKDIYLNKIVIRHRRNISDALKNHGSAVKKELIKIITTGTRSGRVYMYRGKKHIASAPGEPPANRSGKMAKSFIYKSRQQELLIANTAFSSQGFGYPGYLEKNLNRPYFLVTINKMHYQLQSELQDFI